MMGLPFAVEIADVQARVVAVIAPGGAENPAAVGTPGVVALSLCAVHSLKRMCRRHGGGVSSTAVTFQGIWFFVAERQKPQISALVPDVELTVVREGEEQVLAIGRDARHAGTLAQCLGIEDESIDLVVSNCVVNLSPFKEMVMNSGRIYTEYVILTGNYSGREAVNAYADGLMTAYLMGDKDLYERLADTLGKRYAEEHDIPVMSFPADWNKYKKAAGYIRNQEMAQHADALVAFWDGQSRGTKNMIEIAEKIVVYPVLNIRVAGRIF